MFKKIQNFGHDKIKLTCSELNANCSWTCRANACQWTQTCMNQFPHKGGLLLEASNLLLYNLLEQVSFGFYGNFCSLFDIPCGVLSVDCHSIPTRAICSTIPWPMLSFVSFFEVELPFLLLLPHPVFSVALHQWLHQLPVIGIFSLLQDCVSDIQHIISSTANKRKTKGLAPISFLNTQVCTASSELRKPVVPMREVCKLCASYARTRRATSCQSEHWWARIRVVIVSSSPTMREVVVNSAGAS